MSFIDNNSSPPTTESKAANLQTMSKNVYKQIQKVATALQQFFWSDPTQAQSLFDQCPALFGCSAVTICEIAETYQTLSTLSTGITPQITPDGWTVTPSTNDDGTVIVNQTSSSSSSG